MPPEWANEGHGTVDHGGTKGWLAAQSADDNLVKDDDRTVLDSIGRGDFPIKRQDTLIHTKIANHRTERGIVRTIEEALGCGAELIDTPRHTDEPLKRAVLRHRFIRHFGDLRSRGISPYERLQIGDRIVSELGIEHTGDMIIHKVGAHRSTPTSPQLHDGV
jgi:hypothetical protein